VIENTLNFREEVKALIFMDKETKLVKYRKRILALLENGQIMEIKRQDKIKWKKAFLNIASLTKPEQDMDKIELENKENYYEFVNLDKNSNFP